ncbi:PHP domain-like protein [Polychaeton citri CBS 116435]|uniref:PHP domain-like protein n=1 Tax=Polychaeton citri CBS 116435 TaxID=1314669 RepID=A0A9P4UQT8_9PEZI|nr:PHP domain-like protein [Polychaeton citri CBS 116435]
MFYDLNIPYIPNDAGLVRTLNFSHEVGFNVVALNHTITGNLPTDLTSIIPDTSSIGGIPSGLNVRRRVTLVLTEPLQNARLGELARNYDMLALRPTDEKTLQLACGSYDCDIISLDLTRRFPFPFKFKTFGEAISAGKRIELCYSQGIMGDSQARRNLISNATQIIRATRARGLIMSSEAKSAIGVRGPWDVVNLAAVWGLGQERGFEGITKETRNLVANSQLKRSGFRGVIDIVYGGEKPVREGQQIDGKSVQGKTKQQTPNGQKRKAEDPAIHDVDDIATEEKPLSNREKKRRAKKAKLAPIEGDVARNVTSRTEGNSSNPS